MNCEEDFSELFPRLPLVSKSNEQIGWDVEVFSQRSRVSFTDAAFPVKYFRSDSFGAKYLPQVGLFCFASLHQVVKDFKWGSITWVVILFFKIFH